MSRVRLSLSLLCMGLVHPTSEQDKEAGNVKDPSLLWSAALYLAILSTDAFCQEGFFKNLFGIFFLRGMGLSSLSLNHIGERGESTVGDYGKENG